VHRNIFFSSVPAHELTAVNKWLRGTPILFKPDAAPEQAVQMASGQPRL
jgi:hypothetical protein